MEAKIYLLFLLTILLKISIYNFAPVTSSDSFETTTFSNEDLNATDELYVIREVVYEIGILTNGSNSSLEDEEVHEQVELKFFDPDHNESFIDLSNIPVPVQTNVSGQVITGIAPINLGSLKIPISNESDPVLQPENGTAVYPLQNALLSVTTNITTTNPQSGSEILQGLPPLLGFTQTK